MAIKDVILGIAIVILTFSVVIYGINTFYDEPNYEDFCTRDVYNINSESECIEQGGTWSNTPELNGKVPIGRCNDMKCSGEYDSAREKYSRTLFLFTLPLGILILVIGGFLFSLESVGAGLMGGGVAVILYGVGQYWEYSGDVLRFILSILGLIAVIYLSYWMNRKKK